MEDSLSGLVGDLSGLAVWISSYFVCIISDLSGLVDGLICLGCFVIFLD